MGSCFIFLNEGIWLSGPWGVSGSLLSPRGLVIATMRVVVLSASTGVVWEYTSGSFWQARGWELRMWLCEAIHCAHYFSVILLVRQLLLCDMACTWRIC